MKRFLPLLALCALVLPAAADSLDTAQFSKSVEFVATGYAGSTTLENLPVLVRFTTSRPSGFVYADLGSTAAEAYAALRFSDASGENLDYEIDTWNPAGESTVWVSLPSLSGTATKFHAHWGADPDYELPAVTPTAVWTKAGYLGVWHFGETSGTSFADSTGNGLSAVPTAAFTYMGADGPVGGYQTSASGCFVDGIWTHLESFLTSFSGEAWINLNGKTSNQEIFSGGRSWNDKHARFAVRADGGLAYLYGGSAADGGSGGYERMTSLPTTGWMHLVVQYGLGGTAYVLKDGTTSLASGKSRAETADAREAFSLTSQSSGGWPLLGYVDEFRVRGGLSSADWARAVHDTSVPGTDFLTYGAVVSAGAAVAGGDTTVTDVAWTTVSASTTWTISGTGSYAVTLTATAGGTVVATADAGTVDAQNPSCSATLTGLDPVTAYQIQFSLVADGETVYSGVAGATTTQPEAPEPSDPGWTTVAIAGEIGVPGDPATATATIVCTPAGGGAAVTLAGAGTFADGVLTVGETVSGLAENTSYTVRFLVVRDGDAGTTGATASFATSRPAAPRVSDATWTTAAFSATNAVPGAPSAATAVLELLTNGVLYATVAGASAFENGTNALVAATDGLLPGTAFAARLAIDVDGTVVRGAEAAFTTAALGIPSVSDVGDHAATATGAFSLVGSVWTGGTAVFTAFETGETAATVPIADLSAPGATATALAKDVNYTVKFVFARADGLTVETADSLVFFTGVIPFDGKTYRYRMKVTATGYDGGEPLGNFPVLVRLSEDVEDFEYRHVRPAQIRVAGEDGTLWAHEVESWDPDGVSALWVSVPALVSNATFTVCWGPNFGDAPSVDPANVWTRAGYVAVWHFASQNADGSYPDSSGNGATAVPLSAAPSGPTNAVAGKAASPNGTPWHLADKALKVDAESTASWLFSGTGYTTETWVFPESSGNSFDRMFCWGTGGNQGNALAFRRAGGYQMAGDYPYWWWQGYTPEDNGSSTSAWHHVTSTWGYGGGPFVARVYENEGHLAMTQTGHRAVDFTQGMGLTATLSGDGVMNYGVDEARVRKGNTTQAWARANWRTQALDGGLLTLGRVEDHGAGSVLILR